MWTNKSEKGENEFIDDEASKADELLRAASVYKKKQTINVGREHKLSETFNPYRKQLSRRDLDKIKVESNDESAKGNAVEATENLLEAATGLNQSQAIGDSVNYGDEPEELDKDAEEKGLPDEQQDFKT